MSKKKKVEKVGELDVYKDEDAQEDLDKGPLTKLTDGISKVWNKSVFPEKLKNRKEERQLKRKIQHEAKMEAIKESKDEIKEDTKKKLVDKATGKKKKDFLDKLAKGFGADGNNKIGGTAKIEAMLGTGRKTTNSGVGSSDKINAMLGTKSESSKEDGEAKIKRMLGK